MSRVIQASSLIRDQIDLYSSGITRATGLTASSLTLTLFFNNSYVSWPLAAGDAVADSSIASGSVYFNEIAGHAGYYSLRFLPDRVGFWRAVFRCAAPSVEVAGDYDVVPAAVPVASGLNASFVRP